MSGRALTRPLICPANAGELELARAVVDLARRRRLLDAVEVGRAVAAATARTTGAGAGDAAAETAEAAQGVGADPEVAEQLADRLGAGRRRDALLGRWRLSLTRCAMMSYRPGPQSTVRRRGTALMRSRPRSSRADATVAPVKPPGRYTGRKPKHTQAVYGPPQMRASPQN